MNAENEEKFNKLISEHGTDIALAIAYRLHKSYETGERDELLENILSPRLLSREIKGLLPMDGPEGIGFHINCSPQKVVGENKQLGMIDDYDLN